MSQNSLRAKGPISSGWFRLSLHWSYPMPAFSSFSFSLKMCLLVDVIAVVYVCVFHILGVFNCSSLIAFPSPLNCFCSLFLKVCRTWHLLKSSEFPSTTFPSVFKKRHFIALREPLKKSPPLRQYVAPHAESWPIGEAAFSPGSFQILRGHRLFPHLTVHTEFWGHTHSSLRIVSFSL